MNTCRNGHAMTADNIWKNAHGYPVCRECKNARQREYLGRNRANRVRDDVADKPVYEAGCRMPSARSIEIGDRERRSLAEVASNAMLAALHRYARNNHDASAMVIRRAWEARG